LSQPNDRRRPSPGFFFSPLRRIDLLDGGLSFSASSFSPGWANSDTRPLYEYCPRATSSFSELPLLFSSPGVQGAVEGIWDRVYPPPPATTRLRRPAQGNGALFLSVFSCSPPLGDASPSPPGSATMPALFILPARRFFSSSSSKSFFFFSSPAKLLSSFWPHRPLLTSWQERRSPPLAYPFPKGRHRSGSPSFVE